MLAISVGYPLGANNDTFLLQCNGKISEISYKKAAVWMCFHGVKEIEELNEDEKYFNELIAEKLIVTADSTNHLLDAVAKTKPVRQGAGSLCDNKLAVFLGERIIYPTPLQWHIWMQCDGIKKLYEVYSAAKKMINFDPVDFLTALSSLNENDLLYLV